MIWKKTSTQILLWLICLGCLAYVGPAAGLAISALWSGDINSARFLWQLAGQLAGVVILAALLFVLFVPGTMKD